MSAGEQALGIDCDDTPRRTRLDVLKEEMRVKGCRPDFWPAVSWCAGASCPSFCPPDGLEAAYCGFGGEARWAMSDPHLEPCRTFDEATLNLLSSLEAP